MCPQYSPPEIVPVSLKVMEMGACTDGAAAASVADSVRRVTRLSLTHRAGWRGWSWKRWAVQVHFWLVDIFPGHYLPGLPYSSLGTRRSLDAARRSAVGHVHKLKYGFSLGFSMERIWARKKCRERRAGLMVVVL